jgi:hypothetical protein
LADNGLFTFVSSRQNGYDGAAHIRKVLFFKTDGLTVVFDFIDGEESGVYRQNWHFMPSSGAYATGNTINTAFDGKSNISVVNADNDASTGLKSSFFSADYGLAAESRAAYFEKRGKKVKFSTVLKPLRAGESAKTRAADNSEDVSESALYVEDEEKIHIYVRHTEKSDYKAERLCTDAAAAFIGETMYGTVGGSRLIDGSVTYIKADEKISLGVRIIGERAEIYTDERGARLIKSGKVNLYTANAKSVILNGEEILHLMRD